MSEAREEMRAKVFGILDRAAVEVVYRVGYADALREVLHHLGQGHPDGDPMREVREFAAERGIDLESDDDA